jgi:lysozyme family protein
MKPNYKTFVPFVLRWEGGVVNDKSDSGGLTNKGITFTTYSALARSVLKQEPTKANFLNMTATDAELMVKHFWNKATNNNSINSQKIAESVTSWFWGTGRTGLMNFQRLLNNKFKAGLTVDGVIGNQTVSKVNSINADKLFIEMIKARKQFFIALADKRPKDKKFLNGWLNRLNDFYARHKKDSDPALKLLTVVAAMGVAGLLLKTVLNS